MPSLSTEYIGLNLPTPVVVGSSPLTMTAEGVDACARMGAGAVVLKSLFEEQIKLENSTMDQALAAAEQWHSEVFAYMEADIGMRYGSREYIHLVRQCKNATDIPVIASINCISPEWWEDFAAEVAAAGADALELNIAVMPTRLDRTSEDIEDHMKTIVRTAAAAIDIPIAVKLGPYFTNLGRTVLHLRQAGARGFVLFNRFYRPTIDVDNLKITVEDVTSSPAEISPPLRWTSLLAERIDADFAAATGFHTGHDVARGLLAGARCVQVVSTLLKHGGPARIRTLVDDLRAWMETHEFNTVEDFRGTMSQARHPDAKLFGRMQYIKGLVGIE